MLILFSKTRIRLQLWQHWRDLSSARLTRLAPSRRTSSSTRWRCPTTWLGASSAKGARRLRKYARSRVQWSESRTVKSARVGTRIERSPSVATRTPWQWPSTWSTWGRRNGSFQGIPIASINCNLTETRLIECVSGRCPLMLFTAERPRNVILQG